MVPPGTFPDQLSNKPAENEVKLLKFVTTTCVVLQSMG